MLKVNYKVSYGTIKYCQTSDNKVIRIDIHESNALCAFMYHYKKDGQKWSQLISFYADEVHIKNIEKSMKGDPLFFASDRGLIMKIELNLHYRESKILLRHFTKAGYKVICYDKAPTLPHPAR